MTKIDGAPEKKQRLYLFRRAVEYETKHVHYGTRSTCPGHADYVETMITGGTDDGRSCCERGDGPCTKPAEHHPARVARLVIQTWLST